MELRRNATDQAYIDWWQKIKNKIICFYVFGLLMFGAFICVTVFCWYDWQDP